MQAGEIISFIEPEDISIERSTDENEKERAKDRFIALCLGLLHRFNEKINKYESLEEVGIVTLQEVALQIRAADGSSLHVLPFAHNDSEGFLDFGLAVVEHDEIGRAIDGYVYNCDPTQLTRSTVKVDILDNGEADTSRF